MAFTYTKVNFLNNESYNEIKHSKALSCGWPNFVVKGFEYDRETATISSGRAMNGGVTIELGRAGESQSIHNDGTNIFITLVTKLAGMSGSVSTIEMRPSGTVVDTGTEKSFPLYELNTDSGLVRNDFRRLGLMGENKLVLTTSGGLQSEVNGLRSNVVNIDSLEPQRDWLYIPDTLSDQAALIGVSGVITYGHLIEILDYNSTDSLAVLFSQAKDTGSVLNPPITNGELFISRQYGYGGNLVIKYVESGRIGASPYGNYIQKSNFGADADKQFDWAEFARENAGLFDVTEMAANDVLSLPVERDRIYKLELTSLLGTVQDMDVFELKNFYDATQYNFNYFNGFFKNNFGETRKISQENIADLVLNIVGFESLNISLQVETFGGKVRASGSYWGLSPQDENREVAGEFSFETKTVVTSFELTALTALTARLITSEKGGY